MSAPIEHWKSELSTLTVRERAELAHFLIHSLNDEMGPDVDAAWEAELVRRAVDIKSGAEIGKPANEVFAELHEKNL